VRTTNFEGWLTGERALRLAQSFRDSVFSLIKVKVWSCIVLILLMLPASAAELEITALSFDAKILKEKFNSGAHRSRLVMILSPT